MNRSEYIPIAYKFASRGADRHNAVLNEEQVRQIRSRGNGVSAKVWAKMFGCHYRTIEKVQYFETWTHVK